MSPLIAGLAPVFILIVIGWAARAGRIATPEAFGAVNRFGYFVLYPAFLFMLTAGADFSTQGSAPFLIGILGGVLFAVLLALATRFFFRADGPAFTSVFQGSLRWNGFVLLAAALPLYGQAGLDLIGIAFGPLVLTMNIICVMVLSRWGASRAASWRAVIDQIIANPLILSCAAGIAVNLAGFHDFGPLSSALDLLGDEARLEVVVARRIILRRATFFWNAEEVIESVCVHPIGDGAQLGDESKSWNSFFNVPFESSIGISCKRHLSADAGNGGVAQMNLIARRDARIGADGRRVVEAIAIISSLVTYRCGVGGAVIKSKRTNGCAIAIVVAPITSKCSIGGVVYSCDV